MSWDECVIYVLLEIIFMNKLFSIQQNKRFKL